MVLNILAAVATKKAAEGKLVRENTPTANAPVIMFGMGLPAQRNLAIRSISIPARVQDMLEERVLLAAENIHLVNVLQVINGMGFPV